MLLLLLLIYFDEYIFQVFYSNVTNVFANGKTTCAALHNIGTSGNRHVTHYSMICLMTDQRPKHLLSSYYYLHLPFINYVVIIIITDCEGMICLLFRSRGSFHSVNRLWIALELTRHCDCREKQIFLGRRSRLSFTPNF